MFDESSGFATQISTITGQRVSMDIGRRNENGFVRCSFPDNNEWLSRVSNLDNFSCYPVRWGMCTQMVVMSKWPSSCEETCICNRFINEFEAPRCSWHCLSALLQLALFVSALLQLLQLLPLLNLGRNADPVNASVSIQN